MVQDGISIRCLCCVIVYLKSQISEKSRRSFIPAQSLSHTLTPPLPLSLSLSQSLSHSLNLSQRQSLIRRRFSYYIRWRWFAQNSVKLMGGTDSDWKYNIWTQITHRHMVYSYSPITYWDIHMPTHISHNFCSWCVEAINHHTYHPLSLSLRCHRHVFCDETRIYIYNILYII